MRECDRIGTIIHGQWAGDGRVRQGTSRKAGGGRVSPWYRAGTELDPTHLFGQQLTVRDALATALTLDTFNRNLQGKYGDLRIISEQPQRVVSLPRGPLFRDTELLRVRDVCRAPGRTVHPS